MHGLLRKQLGEHTCKKRGSQMSGQSVPRTPPPDHTGALSQAHAHMQPDGSVASTASSMKLYYPNGCLEVLAVAVLGDVTLTLRGPETKARLSEPWSVLFGARALPYSPRREGRPSGC